MCALESDGNDLLPAIILSMLGTIAFRWISYLCGANDLFYVLLPGSMGSLAAGALIAYVMRYDPKNTLLMTFSRWRPYLPADLK